MKSRTIAILLTAASLAFAQGPRGPQPNNPPRTGSGLDMAKLQTVDGAVSVINIAYGSQYPSIQINSTTIKVAPVWFMLENDFEIKLGDKLKVTAAPSLQTADPYLSAITITNTASNETVVLRDTNGIPLWTAQGQGQAQGQGMGSGFGSGFGTHTGCGVSAVATASGTVDQVTAALGLQMPSLVLRTADGKVLTIKIGPERLLDAADFEIKAGDKLTVKYGEDCIGQLIALELTNAAGANIVLRNEDGTPAWH